jgi:lipopolysaccharide/colanic/teichoic acid biosynthesis glycosyltransferase
MQAGAKRALDLIDALALLLVTAPLMIGIALMVRRDGGPVFFRHTRVGLGGRPFACLKFRSMVMDADARLTKLLTQDPAAAEEWATRRKLVADPRITRIGAFLRATSLDELPQLFNVIRGEMSLVVPRPSVRAGGARRQTTVRPPRRSTARPARASRPLQ